MGHRHNIKWGPYIIGDIRDVERLETCLTQFQFDACIHFAALAYVGESVSHPIKYYANNVSGTINLLSALHRHAIKKIVFSSTCATYGLPDHLPISEETAQVPISPYGASKLMIERVLEDLRIAYGKSFVILRYFNACGADSDGDLVEDHDPETHLIPRCLMAASKIIDQVEIFGGDYDTQDGSCVRDYIHVADLANGHVAALHRLERIGIGEGLKINLGAGKGLSVFDIINGVEEVTGLEVPFKMMPRRSGDPATLIASIDKARKELQFEPSFSSLDNILKTAWQRFEKRTRAS